MYMNVINQLGYLSNSNSFFKTNLSNQRGPQIAELPQLGSDQLGAIEQFPVAPGVSENSNTADTHELAKIYIYISLYLIYISFCWSKKPEWVYIHIYIYILIYIYI